MMATLNGNGTHAPETSAFDPSTHLTDIKGSKYLEVKWRLVWLRSEHPEARIETSPIAIDENLAVIQATVKLPLGGIGSGIGSESPQDFLDYIEKAETKAIGRALASAGYGTQFCDDFDTPVAPDGRQRIVDSPVQTANSNGHQNGHQGITDKQVGYIAKLAKKRSPDEFNELVSSRFGKIVNELSRQEASQLIDVLQSSR